MGWLDWIRGSPERRIAKLRKKVKEPHGDASVRENAAQRLFEMGTEPAIRALLERFTINVSPSVQDEREKEEVFGWLVSMGKAAVSPLVHFMKNERSVYWPAKAIREILDRDEYIEVLDEILGYLWENPPATAFPKAQIIRSVGDVNSDELQMTISRYLDDEDDDVRLAAIEYLLQGPEDQSRERILECYLSSEDRPRIRIQILELLQEKGWSVRGFRPAVEETLPDGFSLTRDGKVRRVGA